MARPIEKQLRISLKNSRFDFLGEYNNLKAKEIYGFVKKEFPDLCDDYYLCDVNCKDGYNTPEWHHTVRSTIQSFKKKGLVSYIDKRWFFVR